MNQAETDITNFWINCALDNARQTVEALELLANAHLEMLKMGIRYPDELTAPELKAQVPLSTPFNTDTAAGVAELYADQKLRDPEPRPICADEGCYMDPHGNSRYCGGHTYLEAESAPSNTVYGTPNPEAEPTFQALEASELPAAPGPMLSIPVRACKTCGNNFQPDHGRRVYCATCRDPQPVK